MPSTSSPPKPGKHLGDLSCFTEEQITAALVKLAKFKAFCKRFLKLEIEPFQEIVLIQVFLGVREAFVLLPRGNGKTCLFAALAVYHLLTVERPRVILAAATREQAGIAFAMMRDFVLGHKALRARIKVRHNRLLVDGKRPGAGGFARTIASDTGGNQHGLEVTLGLIDEIHAHRRPDTYVAVKTAMGKRPEAQLVAITTEGEDETGILAHLRDSSLKLPRRENRKTERLTITRTADPKVHCMVRWAALPNDDLTNPAILKKCNPASFVSLAFLKEQIESPGLAPWQLACLHGNRPMPEGVPWLPESAWADCEDIVEAEIPDGAEVWLGIDMGYAKDCAAIVMAHAKGDRWAVKAHVWKPLGNGDHLDLALVEEKVSEIAQTYQVMGVVFDPKEMIYMSQRLADRGFLVVPFEQAPARLAQGSMRLRELIVDGRVIHDGDPVLASHVKAAKKAPAGDGGWRLTKRKAKKPTDACMALMFVLHIAEAEHQPSSLEANGLFFA